MSVNWLAVPNGVVVNVSPGANWGNGIYPLFSLPQTYTTTVLSASWTVLGRNIGQHAYSLVVTGNNLDLDVGGFGSVNGVWAAGSGKFTWGDAGNWNGGNVPGSVGDTTLLGTTVGSGTATITLDVARTLSVLAFSPGVGGAYVLSGTGANALQLANGGSAATISVAGGANAINAPIVLSDNLSVTGTTGNAG